MNQRELASTRNKKLLLSFTIILISLGFLLAQDEPNCISSSYFIEHPGKAIPSKSFLSVEDESLSDFIVKQVNPKIKMVMIGEQHWMKVTTEFVANTVCHLAATRQFENLVIEYPYSYTGFINEFINSKPGEKENLLTIIGFAFDMQEEVEMLRTIQEWNWNNKKSKIRILCSDFEQDYSFPFIQILIPFFAQMGDTTIINHIMRVQSVDDQLVSLLDSIMLIIPNDLKSDTYEFIDKKYVSNTIQNIRSSYLAHQFIEENEELGFEEFMKKRTEQIIQNLTDLRIFGHFLNKEKSVLWGGSNHMAYQKHPLKKAYLNEGTFFKKKFKNRVLGINVSVLSYGIPEIYYEQEANTPLSSYNMLVASYLECYPESNKEYLILEALNSVSQWILSNMQSTGRACTIVAVKKNEILTQLVREEEDLGAYLDFDYHLFIKESKLFAPNK